MVLASVSALMIIIRMIQGNACLVKNARKTVQKMLQEYASVILASSRMFLQMVTSTVLDAPKELSGTKKDLNAKLSVHKIQNIMPYLESVNVQMVLPFSMTFVRHAQQTSSSRIIIVFHVRSPPQAMAKNVSVTKGLI